MYVQTLKREEKKQRITNLFLSTYMTFSKMSDIITDIITNKLYPE